MTGWTDDALDRRILVAAAGRSTSPAARSSGWRVQPRRHDHVVLCSAHHVAVDYWSLVLLMDELQRSTPTSLAGRRFVAAGSRPVSTSIMPGGSASTCRAPKGWLGTLAPPARRGPTASVVADRLAAAAVADLPRSDPPFHARRRSSATGTVASARGTTLYTVCLAAFAVLLHRYTGETDLLIGSPMAGRTSTGAEDVVGYFANTIVLRARCDDNPRFTDFLAHVSATVLDALEGQDFPFPLLVERLKVARDPGRAPLCDVLFSWDKPHYRGTAGRGRRDLRFETRESASARQHARPDGDRLRTDDRIDVALQYSVDLFTAETVARMAGHFSICCAGSPTIRPNASATCRCSATTSGDRPGGVERDPHRLSADDTVHAAVRGRLPPAGRGGGASRTGRSATAT